jgi:hypothetical protein
MPQKNTCRQRNQQPDEKDELDRTEVRSPEDEAEQGDDDVEMFLNPQRPEVQQWVAMGIWLKVARIQPKVDVARKERSKQRRLGQGHQPCPVVKEHAEQQGAEDNNEIGRKDAPYSAMIE